MNCVQSTKENKIQKSIETKMFGVPETKLDSGVIIETEGTTQKVA